jgi:hypothetical protein
VTPANQTLTNLPAYKGSGDPNDARSFVCKAAKGHVLDD